MKLEFYVIGFNDNFRGNELVAQLRKYGFPVNVVEADDFRSISLSKLNYDVCLSQLWNGRPLASSELGCLSSHRKTWEMANLIGVDWAFIFEDDAKIEEGEFDAFIQRFIDYRNWSTKPQLISFYWPYAIENKFAGFFERKSLLSLDLFKAAHPTYGTVGYAVNASAIAKLRKKPELEATTADWPIEVFSTNFYVTQRNLITHPDDTSTIQDMREIVQLRLKKVDQNEESGFALTHRFKNILSNTLSLRKVLKKSGYSRKYLLLQKRFLYQLYYFGYLKLPFLKIRNGSEQSRSQKSFPLIILILLRYLLDVSMRVLRAITKLSMLNFLNNYHASRRIFLRLTPRYFKSIFKEITSNVNYIQELEKKFNSTHFRVHRRSKAARQIQSELPRFETLQTESESIACVLTVFNQSATQIERSVTSLLKQTSSFSEIIIVDDGSTDNETVDYLGQGFSAPNIKFIRQENSGVCRARNVGAELCQSKWIVFFDPDDLMDPEYCEEALKLISVAPTLDIVCGKVRINTDGKISHWDPGPFGASYMLAANRIPMSSLIRRDFFFQIGGFNSEFKNLGSEDWDLWSRAVFYGARIGKMKGFAYEYVVDTSQSSRSKLTDHNRILQRDIIRKTYFSLIENLRAYYSPKN